MRKLARKDTFAEKRNLSSKNHVDFYRINANSITASPHSRPISRCLRLLTALPWHYVSPPSDFWYLSAVTFGRSRNVEGSCCAFTRRRDLRSEPKLVSRIEGDFSDVLLPSKHHCQPLQTYGPTRMRRHSEIESLQMILKRL